MPRLESGYKAECCLSFVSQPSRGAVRMPQSSSTILCVCVELLNRGTSGGWFSEKVPRQGLHREKVPSSCCLGLSGLLAPVLRVPWAESTAPYPALSQHWQLCGGTLDPLQTSVCLLITQTSLPHGPHLFSIHSLSSQPQQL